MTRGTIVGLLLALAARRLATWWARFSAPYGMQPQARRGW